MSTRDEVEELKADLADMKDQRDHWQHLHRREIEARHDWEDRYHRLLTERDSMRAERDEARRQAAR